MTGTKIILVDDNAWEQVAAQFVSLFKLHGLHLECLSSVDSSDATIFRDSRCPADLFIIDVMMPPGNKYSNEETHGGLITGLYLAQEIRAQFPHVPIVLWSGTALNTVRLLAVHMEEKLTKCIFVQKPIPADKIVSVIESYFKNGRFSKPILSRIWDGIVIRPSIGGMGMDVKKLLGGST